MRVTYLLSRLFSGEIDDLFPSQVNLKVQIEFIVWYQLNLYFIHNLY